MSSISISSGKENVIYLAFSTVIMSLFLKLFYPNLIITDLRAALSFIVLGASLISSLFFYLKIDDILVTKTIKMHINCERELIQSSISRILLIIRPWETSISKIPSMEKESENLIKTIHSEPSLRTDIWILTGGFFFFITMPIIGILLDLTGGFSAIPAVLMYILGFSIIYRYRGFTARARYVLLSRYLEDSIRNDASYRQAGNFSYAQNQENNNWLQQIEEYKQNLLLNVVEINYLLDRKEWNRFEYLFSLVFLQIVPPMASGQSSEGSIKSGPYVDKIKFKVITQPDQQFLALNDDEIDIIGDIMSPRILDWMWWDEDIDVATSLRNGYGYLTINCRKYPFNVTALRRALAFALDKEAITDDIWDGLSQPQDSVVPIVNPFTIEGQLLYNYYSADIEMGNYLLDQAGFEINETTGYRMAPNGSAFDVLIEFSSWSIAGEVCQKVVEALGELHIEATSTSDIGGETIHGIYYHDDYDMYFLDSNHNSFDVDWLAYNYWSEYADEPYWNSPNFKNASYDSWREQLLHSTDYDEVYEAAIEMQRVWVYQSPEIICYENIVLSVYRTDRFEGWVNDVIDGVSGWWINYKVHLKNDQSSSVGGTLRISTTLDVDTFNFMTGSSKYTWNILSLLYDSLIRIGPDGNDVDWLAESYVIETHSDSSNIPDGHTRITFNILDNATWSDGMPLTAEDVAFTLNYYRNGLDNPYGSNLIDMTAAYATTLFTVIVEFDTESYWHLHTVGYKPIIPKHVFTNIGFEDWNPTPPDDIMVTSGPFNISDYVAGEYIELTRNPEYFFAVNTSSFDTTTTTTTTTTINNPLENIMDFIRKNTLLIWTLTVSSVAILVIMLAKWRIEKT